MGTISANQEFNINTFYDHKFVFEVNDNDKGIQQLHFTKGRDDEEIELRYNEESNELEYQLNTKNRDVDGSADDVPMSQMKKLERSGLKVDMSYVLSQIRNNHKNTIQFDNSYKLDTSIRFTGGIPSMIQVLSDITRHCYSTFSGFQAQFLPCMAANIMDDITALSGAKTKLEQYSSSISNRLRNYTCIDEAMQTSTPIYTYNTTLQYRGVDREYEVKVMLDKNHSKIWTVDNFVS